MKIPTFSVCPLALAVVAALVLSSPVVGKSTAVTDAFTATVLFGDASVLLLPDARPLAVSGLPVIRPADAGGIAPETARHVLAVVHASSLPLDHEQAATLGRLFKQGMPVLVRMDSRTPDDVARVGAHFGSAPNLGDMIVRNEEGAIGVFASASENLADTSALLNAFAVSAETPRQPGPGASLDAFRPEADTPDPRVGLPKRTIHFNLVDPEGQIGGLTTVEVARSRTPASDFKLLRLSSKVTITPPMAGVKYEEGLFGDMTLYRPYEYYLRHSVAVQDRNLLYLDHFPVSDGATEFTQSETRTSGFSIGGSMGAEVSPTGKADAKIAARLPFKASVSFEDKWQSTLSNSFKDYSLQAQVHAQLAPKAVSWKALLAPEFKGRRYNLRNKEANVTPMMTNAAFETASYWQIPGQYEGVLIVGVTAGYEMKLDDWKGDPYAPPVKTIKHMSGNSFEVPMSDPYLTAELTVLIRSATGSGSCLRDNGGTVDLVACQPTDSSQQWGLDEASRYVNRKSKLCLTAQPSAGSVVMQLCEGLTFEKQWQWRADRLHSLIEHERYRMYVADGQVLVAKKGRFPDFPANYSSPALEPWTNYPAAPRQGIDLVVGQAGTWPVPVGPEYAGLPAVTSDQRWRIEVLRQGL